MNRVAWSSAPDLTRISVACSSCTVLLERRCVGEGNPFYARPVIGRGECEVCGQVELGLISA